MTADLASISPAVRKVLILSIAYFLAAWLGIHLTREAANLASLWPANALLLGVLLRSQPGLDRNCILGCAVANLSANLVAGDSILVSVGFAVCNMAEVLVAAQVLVRIVPGGWHRLTSRHGLAFGIVAGGLAPLVGAVMGAALIHMAYNAPYWTVLRTWWVADAMGILLVTPVILTWRRAKVFETFKERGIEMLTIAVAIVVSSIYLFSQPHFPLLYVVTPLLLWAAFRLETFGTAAAALAVSSIAVISTIYGLGPIPEMTLGSVPQRVQFLQLYLGVAILVPLVVAVMSEERHRLIGELERKNAELERYAYTVSHDLKAPLITIEGYVSHLSQDLKLDAHKEVYEDISEIENATATMHKLLNDVLELSKHGVVANRNNTFSLAELINNVVESIPDNSTVSVRVSMDLPCIRGDRDRLAIVVRNVLDNARRFAREGQALDVAITAECRPDDIVCRFRDNGIGIAKEHVERVFGLFERLNGAAPGSGVGLAIVRRIIEAHSGNVWIESEGIGRGTTVAFSLPRGESVAALGGSG